MNPALVAMLGYDSAAELMAIDIPNELYVDAERARPLDDRDRQRRASGVVRPDVAAEGRSADRGAAFCASRARRDTATCVWYEGIAENVTERLRREAVVRRAERMASLGHTLAGVAHELNNPLAAISGFAQILLKTQLAEGGSQRDRDDPPRGEARGEDREGSADVRAPSGIVGATSRGPQRHRSLHRRHAALCNGDARCAVRAGAER